MGLKLLLWHVITANESTRNVNSRPELWSRLSPTLQCVKAIPRGYPPAKDPEPTCSIANPRGEIPRTQPTMPSAESRFYQKNVNSIVLWFYGYSCNFGTELKCSPFRLKLNLS